MRCKTPLFRLKTNFLKTVVNSLLDFKQAVCFILKPKPYNPWVIQIRKNPSPLYIYIKRRNSAHCCIYTPFYVWYLFLQDIAIPVTESPISVPLFLFTHSAMAIAVCELTAPYFFIVSSGTSRSSIFDLLLYTTYPLSK